MSIPGNVMAVLVDDSAGYGHIARELRKLPVRDVEVLEARFAIGIYPEEWTKEERDEAYHAAECIVSSDWYRRSLA